MGNPFLPSIERLSLFFGLPVFASDALSSAAYATEAIISILILAGIAAVGLQPQGITLAICALYLIVVISYQQTVKAYPTGGGSYIVAADNLGEKPAVIAGSALLIDYILTVAVSVAAGVAALVSAFPTLHSALIPLNIGFIALIAWANLRGVRESGMMFALPSYGFVLGMIVMIIWGVTRAGEHQCRLRTSWQTLEQSAARRRSLSSSSSLSVFCWMCRPHRCRSDQQRGPRVSGTRGEKRGD